VSHRAKEVGRPRRRLRPAGVITACGLALLLLAAGAPGARAAGPAPLDLTQGCGRPPPPEAPSAIAVAGRSRALITVVPADYRPSEPHALVIAFHGRTSSNATVRRYYDLERYAHTPTIFVYPAGLPEPGGRYSWSDPGDRAGALRDYALFDALLAQMARSYCLDPDRIFALGHSLGGWFANSLGCARGDVLRAVGSLASGIVHEGCRGAVAALLFHNPHDRMVAYVYGLEAREVFRAENHAESPGGRIALGGFACRRYGDPAAVNPVIWCPHTRDRSSSGRYYPHNWPAGAGAAMMAFFDQLPAASTAAAGPALASAPGG
jgi:polyhydroxybutyrate depolymerase